MAEKLCELRKKGGGGAKYTETSLWTNPSPTSGFPASGSSVDITLSESMANYKYIKIKYVRGTSSPQSSQYSSVEYLSEDLLAFDSSGGAFRGSLGHLDANTTAQYSRVFMTVNNTTLRFYLVYKQGSTNSYNSTVIPVEILGLNELDHGKRFDETTLWTNSASSSTFAAQEITLSDDIDNYDYIAIDYKYSNNISDGDYSTVMQTPANIKKGGYNTSVTRCGLALDYISGGNANYARQVFYVSDTKLRFDIGRQFGGTNSSNANAIPLRVVGCKFR